MPGLFVYRRDIFFFSTPVLRLSNDVAVWSFAAGIQGRRVSSSARRSHQSK